MITALMIDRHILNGSLKRSIQSNKLTSINTSFTRLAVDIVLSGVWRLCLRKEMPKRVKAEFNYMNQHEISCFQFIAIKVTQNDRKTGNYHPSANTNEALYIHTHIISFFLTK